MAGKGSRLAARFRRALEHEKDRHEHSEEARLEELAEGRQARSELFDELESFGRELGFVRVSRGEGVQLQYGDRHLHFAPDGEGEGVRVDFPGRGEDDQHRLYREAELGGRWVWVRVRRKKEVRLPLFDQGLEVLLVHALDLPEPDESGSEPTPVAPSEGPAAGDGGPTEAEIRAKRTL